MLDILDILDIKQKRSHFSSIRKMQRKWRAWLLLTLLLWISGPGQHGFSLHQVSYGPERLQQGDLVTPGSTPRGIVMLIHGGFWKAGFDRSLMVKIADDLVSKNFCVWNVDYRSDSQMNFD